MPQIKQQITAFLFLACLWAQATTPALSQDSDKIRGSGPLFSKAATLHQDSYERLLTSLQNVSKPIDISIRYYEAKRAIREIEKGNLDFHYPIMCGDQPKKTNLVREGSEPLGFVPMGIFSPQKLKLTKEKLATGLYQLKPQSKLELSSIFSADETNRLMQLSSAFKSKNELIESAEKTLGRGLNQIETEKLAITAYQYRVATHRSHIPSLNFPAVASISIENSIENVVRRRLDAVITPPAQAEQYILLKDYDHLFFRALHKIHQGCFVVENSSRGEKIDRIISEGFKKLKLEGHYDQIFEKNDRIEKDWVTKYGN